MSSEVMHFAVAYQNLQIGLQNENYSHVIHSLGHRFRHLALSNLQGKYVQEIAMAK
jgi:hypothetical protein